MSALEFLNAIVMIGSLTTAGFLAVLGLIVWLTK